MFEKNTAKQYPKERFSLNSIYDGAYLCGSSKNKNLDSGQYSSLGHFTSKGVEELFNLPDYSIILKFKQLFKILCDKKTEQDSYKKLCRQLEKKGADISEITKETGFLREVGI